MWPTVPKRLGIATIATSLISHPGNAECLTKAEQAAFAVQALKTEMMLVAESCHEQDRYNQFVHRLLKEIRARESRVDVWMRRHGRSPATFVTDLANEQSRWAATTMGAEFCSRTSSLVDEIGNLKSAEELEHLAITQQGEARSSIIPAACTESSSAKVRPKRR